MREKIKKLLKDFGIAVLFALLVILIIVWLAYTIFLLKNDPPLANAYVAVSTLILALATVLLAGLTWLIIRSGEKRENRNRKERLLNEIIEWAIDITRAEFGGEIAVTPGISGKIQRRLVDVNRLLECQVLQVKGEEMLKPLSLSIHSELTDAINQVITSLNVAIGVLKRGVPYTESDEAKAKLLSNDAVLEQNIRNLLKTTSKYRI